MYSVNDEQIDFILNDIRRRGVEMEDLQYNLLDHICCIVEQNLESDGNFEDFYNKTIPKFFKHELWEIEEETILLLTYKNYYTMKKAMIYGGVISLSLIALGTVFKIFHWPGAAISLLLGFFVLCFMFFPSALYLNYTTQRKSLGSNLAAFIGGTVLMLGVLFKVMHWPGTAPLLIAGFGVLLGILVPLLLVGKLKGSGSSKEKLIYTIGALGIMMFGSSILFKIMHWPGAGPLLILGSVLTVAVFIPLYTNVRIKENKMSAGQFVFTITLSMYAVMLTSLLALNVSKHVLERFVKDETDNVHIVNYFEKKKQRLLSEQVKDSVQIAQTETNKLISESASQVKDLIRTIRTELVGLIEGADKTRAQELASHPVELSRMDNYDLVNHLLLIDPNTQYASKLKTAIRDYKSVVLKFISNEQMSSKFSKLLNTEDTITPEFRKTWEETNFRNCPLIIALGRLSEIETNIYLIETEVLTLKK